MMKYQFNIPNIGILQFPEDIDKFYSKDGYLISQRYGENSYFEMDGEYLYYCLKYLEKEYKYDFSKEKQRVIDALINRSRLCGGFWKHSGWVNNDTQLRASSSAIRTLIQGNLDGFIAKERILEFMEEHFKYFSRFEGGIWFLHDTAEFDESIMEEGSNFKLLKSNIWGKSETNTLTLNTHVDTLNTLLYAIKFLEIDEFVNNNIYLLKDSIKAINFVIQKNNNIFTDFVELIDFYYLKRNLKNKVLNHSRSNIFIRFYNRIAHSFLLKIMFPHFFYTKGFIERDLGKWAYDFNYHTVNLWDLSRLHALSKSIKNNKIMCVGDLDLNGVENIIRKGVELVFREKYFKLFVQKNKPSLAQLQETLYYLSKCSSKTLDYNKLLVDISNKSPLSVINLGYDPFGKLNYED